MSRAGEDRLAFQRCHSTAENGDSSYHKAGEDRLALQWCHSTADNGDSSYHELARTGIACMYSCNRLQSIVMH